MNKSWKEALECRKGMGSLCTRSSIWTVVDTEPGREGEQPWGGVLSIRHSGGGAQGAGSGFSGFPSSEEVGR